MATLAELARRYLAQPLPDISGIFQPREDVPVEDDDPVEETTPGITPQLLQQTGGGGDNFNVFNPDPTRLRTIDNYSPYAGRQAIEKTFYDTTTAANKMMGMYPDYYGVGQKTGIERLLSKLPGQGILKGITDALPVNRRAILENEALGAGIALDDIGRIVQGSGDYNTAENVMAGYNLAKITPETIQKRRDMINAKMKDPEQKAARLKALDDFENKMFGTGGITDLSDIIFDQKSKIKDPTYKSTDELIELGIKSAEDDDEDDMLEKIIEAQKTGMIIPGISFAPGMGFGVSPLGEFGTGITSIKRPNIIQDIGIQSIKDNIERGRERERQRAAEAAFAAAGGDRQQQAMQRARDQQTIDAANRAFRDDPGAKSYSGGERTRGDDTSYSDPFDPGGGE